MTEHAVIAPCGIGSILGVLNRPVKTGSVGVVMVPAGAQYRVGANRQYVRWARRLASEGIPSLRFDPCGIGDSSGPFLDFDMAADIRTTAATLLSACADLEAVVLCGICGSATVVATHVGQVPGVAGLVLINPWVRTTETLAVTHLKHHYFRRLAEPDFWRRLIVGDVRIRSGITGLVTTVATAGRGVRNRLTGLARTGRADGTDGARRFAEQMLRGLAGFDGRILLIISEKDTTGREFLDVASNDRRWRTALDARRTQTIVIEDADHMFSSQTTHEAVATALVEWVKRLSGEQQTTVSGEICRGGECPPKDDLAPESIRSRSATVFPSAIEDQRHP